MSENSDFLPRSGMDVPRFAGPVTFMKLPLIEQGDPRRGEVQIGFIGVPFDGGTTNRPGARHGPRALRDASGMIRLLNQATRVRPFHLARCADLGDCPVNPASLDNSLALIEGYYRDLAAAGIKPMSAGGDHLISLPILRGLVGKGEPVGLIQFDAHTDFYDDYFGGYRYTHGTPFRRAVEEGLIDPKRVVQIGIRGTSFTGEDVEFGRSAGAWIVPIEEFEERGADAVIDEARERLGDGPVYASFDIDALDPATAPGTGTPEIGGFTTREAQRLVRRMGGLNLIGADLVEVSPPFDSGGLTAWVGANLMFELLCDLALAVEKDS